MKLDAKKSSVSIETSNTVLPHNNNNSKADFEWSLRPISIWAAMLGYDLGLYQGSVGRLPSVRLIIFGLGTVLFLTNLWVNLESIGHSFWIRLIEKKLNKNQDTTTYIKVLSGFAADAFFSIGLPLIFFVFSLYSRRWKEVRDQIFFVQREMKPSEKFHIECRKQCYIALILLVLDIALQITHELATPTSSLNKLPNISFNIALTLCTLSRLSAITVQSFLYIMISTCRLLFRELNLRVQTLSRKVDRYGNDVDHSSRFGFEFEKWFRHYDSVCTLVGKINRCFGLILIVTLSHSVVISIRYGTMVVAMAESKNPNRCTVAVFFLIRVLSLLGIHIRLWAIIIKSHQMYVETWRIRRAFERATCAIMDPQLKTQVTTILLQITHNQPKISARGMVHVDLSLLLPLESAVISYTILVCQNQTIEATSYTKKVGMCEFYQPYSADVPTISKRPKTITGPSSSMPITLSVFENA